jgi:oligopeptidase B
VGEGEVLLDLGAVAEAGGSTYAETGVCELSPDGRWLAWSVDLDGDEVYSLRFRDLTTGDDLAEGPPRSYYGGAWSAGSDHFFYTVHDEAYRPFQVWRHHLGTPVADDVLVLQEDDAHFEVVVEASRSGEQVVITAMSRDTTEVHLIPADDPLAPPRLVEARRPGVEYHVEHAPWDAPGGRRDELLIVTDDGATEYRLVSAPTATPGREHWAPVLDEDPAVRLVAVDAFATHYVLTLRRGGAPLLRLVARDGSSSVEVLPDEPAGTVALGTNEEFAASSVTVSVESYTEPTVWWDVPLDGSPRRERLRREVPSYDPSQYGSHRVWIVSPDGTEVPVTVVRRLDTPLDGTAPCLLYGYGAYEYSYEPLFDRTLPTLLDHGVVFAHAHVRGGGEMGGRWWQHGRLLEKKNTFVDFAAAADTLAHDGALALVDGTRIVGRGGSAGGLLQGASYSLRPDRWRALVAEVPFVDCVNSMLDASLPLTVGEWDEWGDPHLPEYLAYIGSYAPYENLPDPEVRPALLVTGAVHDPRVLVHEPAKWVAALRSSDPRRGAGRGDGRDPVAPGVVLFRVVTDEGSHGGAAGRYAALHEEAEVQAWILAAMGIAPR